MQALLFFGWLQPEYAVQDRRSVADRRSKKLLRLYIRSVGSGKGPGRPTGRTLLGIGPAYLLYTQSPQKSSRMEKFQSWIEIPRKSNGKVEINGDGGGKSSSTPPGNGRMLEKHGCGKHLPLRESGQDMSKNRSAGFTSPLRAVREMTGKACTCKHSSFSDGCSRSTLSKIAGR